MASRDLGTAKLVARVKQKQPAPKAILRPLKPFARGAVVWYAHSGKESLLFRCTWCCSPCAESFEVMRSAGLCKLNRSHAKAVSLPVTQPWVCHETFTAHVHEAQAMWGNGMVLLLLLCARWPAAASPAVPKGPSWVACAVERFFFTWVLLQQGDDRYVAHGSHNWAHSRYHWEDRLPYESTRTIGQYREQTCH